MEDKLLNSYLFIHKTANTDYRLRTFEVTAADLLKEFYYFMLGAGFSEQTVQEAFEEVAETHEKDHQDN